MIDFPNTPTLNQIFTVGGASWQWDGTKWIAYGVGGALPLPVSIANGGTAAVTAPAALTNLGAVAKAGDTMTGNLTIAPAAGASQILLRKPAAGQGSVIAGQTGANNRWVVTLGDTVAEGGSNAGSNFLIGRYNDAGAPIDSPITITRSTGTVSLSPTIQLAGVNFAQFAGNYATIFNASGSGVFIAGNAADATNYHRNTGHSFQNLAASATYAVFNSVGTYNVSGAWIVLSDRELKQDLAPYTRGLDAILALNPVTFRYMAGSSFATETPSEPLIGLIADEVEPHLPELVGEHTDEKGHTVATLVPGNLVYALINAVKELSARLEAAGL